MQIFVKGYTNEFRDTLLKRGNYIARCESCKYYFGECTNKEVTSYDICKDGDRNFCCFWLPEEV